MEKKYKKGVIENLKVSVPNRTIDNVTVENLTMLLRCCGFYLSDDEVDHIIDMFELLETKGDDVTLKDIHGLKCDWKMHSLFKH